MPLPLRVNILRALAKETRFDFLREALPPRTQPFWSVIVRAGMGLCYAVIASLAALFFRSPFMGAVVGTILILALHTWLTQGRDSDLAGKALRELLPAFGKTLEPSTYLAMAQLLLAGLLLCLLLYDGALWLTAVMAVAAALGTELAENPDWNHESQTTTLLLREGRCWIAALATVFLFTVLPHAWDRSMAHVEFLRALFLTGGALLLCPWLKLHSAAGKPSPLSRMIATYIVLLLAILAKAL